MSRSFDVTLGGRGLSLGLSWDTLEALSRVPVAKVKGEGTTGFCPFKLLRGELDPSFPEAVRLIATASGLRPSDIVALSPGWNGLRDAVVAYTVALCKEFNPRPEDAPTPKT
jgi:hypothetical protein